jgi:hypothetical protein
MSLTTGRSPRSSASCSHPLLLGILTSAEVQRRECGFAGTCGQKVSPNLQDRRPVEGLLVEGPLGAARWELAVPAEGRVGDVRRRAGALHRGVTAVAARGRICPGRGEMHRKGAR